MTYWHSRSKIKVVKEISDYSVGSEVLMLQRQKVIKLMMRWNSLEQEDDCTCCRD